MKAALAMMERGLLPRWIIRVGVKRLLAQRLSDERRGGIEAEDERRRAFLREMEASPLAIHTKDANEQHYEVPTEFFRFCLGPRMKYSSGYWPRGVTSLAGAEEAMLDLYAQRGELRDGQHVLELGCGWGSLSLWMAEKYPNSRITAVSNSRTQREYIETQAKQRGLTNLRIVTCDMNSFVPEGDFDRVVSVEMFEHMRNWRLLFSRIAGWLRPGGKLFFHIFTHGDITYPFVAANDDDWMARHFFTGGMMPADDLPLNFQDHLALEDRWRVDGRHYGKTARAWLDNMDANRGRIEPILASVYGASNTTMWRVRWEVFFIACEELWNYAGGGEWLVSHYRFAKR
ncbi:MAG: SAM-dependent methyltransferase [Phycisphaerales bacterium]